MHKACIQFEKFLHLYIHLTIMIPEGSLVLYLGNTTNYPQPKSPLKNWVECSSKKGSPGKEAQSVQVGCSKMLRERLTHKVLLCPKS